MCPNLLRLWSYHMITNLCHSIVGTINAEKIKMFLESWRRFFLHLRMFYVPGESLPKLFICVLKSIMSDTMVPGLLHTPFLCSKYANLVGSVGSGCLLSLGLGFRVF